MKLMMILLLLLCLSGCAWAEEDVTLHVVNVGKADALILRGYGETYLIDTGTEEAWPALSRALHSQGIERLSGVIVTHTDKDHGGGAEILARSAIAVDGWYMSPWYTCKESKHPVLKAAAIRQQQPIVLSAGDTLPFGAGSIRVLGPQYEDPEKENNNSLVLMVEAQGRRLLLAGDMEEPEEESLLRANLSLRADVLKVGNHGEGDATSEKFALAVSPEIAVISTNTEEEPDTPDPMVLRILAAAGAAVLETQDSDAGVLVTISGGEVSAGNASYTNLPAPVKGMRLISKGEDDAVVLRNDGNTGVDVSQWIIVSEKGGQTFLFPEGTVIQPGQQVTITTESSRRTGDFLWPDEDVWHQKKDDACILYDLLGREMDRLR